MIHYNCQNCGASMVAPDTWAGKSDVCPECNFENIIPFKSSGIGQRLQKQTGRQIKKVGKKFGGRFLVICVVAMLIGSVVTVLTRRKHSSALSLPVLESGWQRITISDMGTIDIPPVMEIQSDLYRKRNKTIRKRVYGLNESDSRIIIQQKGLNISDPDAAKLFVRIMIKTTKVRPGEVGTLDSEPNFSDSDINELKAAIRRSPFIKDPIFYQPNIEKINGMKAFRISYKRKGITKAPPVFAEIYFFSKS